MQSCGWQIDVQPLLSDEYLTALYAGSTPFRESLRGYWRRLRALLTPGQYDLVLLEKEVFPFLPASIDQTLVGIQAPYVVDYDDALFHGYDQHRSPIARALFGKKIDSVMRGATLVIAGNNYIGHRAKAAGARHVEIIPTVVDLDRYSIVGHRSTDSLVVGWIGTPKTERYLLPLLAVFDSLKRELNIRIVAVGGRFDGMDGIPIDTLPWAEETEVQSIQNFDIGIMPLNDSPWERGKCGYKLIQYMACGLPVIASPVGANTAIVEEGENGYLAANAQEWLTAIRKLAQNSNLRSEMGLRGRQRVEEWFCLQVQAPRLERTLRSAADCVRRQQFNDRDG